MTTRSRERSIRRLLAFALILMLVAVIVGGVLVARSRALTLVYPQRKPLTAAALESAVPGQEDVTFTTEDGLTLRGWFIPSDADPDGAAVILVHGFGDNREGMLPLAEALVARGYHALLFDLRNHGESDGAITTMGYLEVGDVQAAMSYLQTRPEVDPTRIAIIGHSLGAATVLRAGARIPAVRAVVAISPFTSLEDNVAQGVRNLVGLPPFPFAPLVVWFGEQAAGVSLSAVRPIDDVAAIAPRAVLFVHGDRDDLLDPGNSQQLYDAAGEPKALYFVPGGGHGDILQPPAPETVAVIAGFLDDHLRGG